MRVPVKLLVSVRSSQEADAALDGGADIIDVKEPERGSLGRAQPNVIAEIADLVRSKSSSAILSAALGEVAQPEASLSSVLSHMFAIDLVKSGLSGLDEAHLPWQDIWKRFRETAPVTHPRTQWVAVAYADSERSGSPSVVDVLEEGHRIACPVLLIDTFQKDGTSLLDWVSPEELHRIRCRTREYGMKLALAGQLTAALLPHVLAAGPDIIAVRGAVCENGQRRASVTADRVRQFSVFLQRIADVPLVK